jgi:hypothetical protein
MAQGDPRRLCVERLSVHWMVSRFIESFWDNFSQLSSLAANAVGIPSILITNFTFDSVYSYLSTTLLDPPAEEHHFHALIPDIPVPLKELEPLGDL